MSSVRTRQGSTLASLALGCIVALPVRAAIVIDGTPDEAEWQQAQAFDQFVVTQPYTLAKPSYPTVARILGTPQGIAVSFVAQQPAAVPRQRSLTPRDADSPGDRVNIYIDFDADGVVAYNLTVALSGAQQDATITNENRWSADWDGDFETAVAEQAESWSAEILIPWNVASMRDSEAATRTVAVLFDRVVGSLGERSATAPESFERGRFVSNFPKLQIAQFQGGSLHVFPYVSVLQDLVDDAFEAKAGADLQWKPSGNFQLVAALNPDFGQVESDQLVVNFDAIETYFSDKRPFFTENQGMFNLATPNNGQLIYTRRIGAEADDGSGAAAEIDAAVKVTGSSGALRYGALTAIESDYADDLGRAFYAQRLAYPVGPWTLGYAGTWTDRPFLDRSAFVHAADATWRPSEHVLLVAQAIASDIDVAGREQRGSGAWLRLDLTPPGPLRHQLELSHFGASLDFNDLGFLPRNSYNELEWSTEYTYNAYAPGSMLNSTTWHLEPQVRFNDTGDLLPPVLLVYRRDTWRSGVTSTVESFTQFEGVDDLISRGNGRVRRPLRNSLYSSVETPRRGDWKFRAGAWLFQEGLDGWAFQAESSVTYYAGDRLTLNGYFNPRWSRDWLIWHHDNQLASYARQQYQAGLNIDWLPADRHELRAKVQWLAIDAESADAYRIGYAGALVRSDETIPDFAIKNFGLQLRYRWTFAPQSDLYVVYSRGGFSREDDDRDGLTDLFADSFALRDSDQFLVKVRYRF